MWLASINIGALRVCVNIESSKKFYYQWRNILARTQTIKLGGYIDFGAKRRHRSEIKVALAERKVRATYIQCSVKT